jgi:hypothetical protein
MTVAIGYMIELGWKNRIECPIDNAVYIKKCSVYLLSLEDDEFKNIYTNMPTSYDEFTKIYTNMPISYDEFGNKDTYTLCDYVYAYVSNIDLLRKCLAISPVTINTSIRILINNASPFAYKYLRLDLESCKLLRDSGCNIINLLNMAYNISDYATVRYLIESMSKMELMKLFIDVNNLLFNIFGILFIDAISTSDDADLNEVLYNTLSKINDGQHCPSTEHICALNHKLRIVLQCYYAIKYLPRDEALELINHQNQRYDYFLLTDEGNKPHVEQIKTFHNNLLEFHFRPRGSHTKSAVTIS